MRMIDTHFHIGVMPHEYLHILGLAELETVIVPSDQMIPDYSTLEMVRHYVSLAANHVAIQHHRFSPLDRLNLRKA